MNKKIYTFIISQKNEEIKRNNQIIEPKKIYFKKPEDDKKINILSNLYQSPKKEQEKNISVSYHKINGKLDYLNISKFCINQG